MKKCLITEFFAQFGDNVAFILVFPVELVDRNDAVATVFGNHARRIFLIDHHHSDVGTAGRIPRNFLVVTQQVHDTVQGFVDLTAEMVDTVCLPDMRIVPCRKDRQHEVRIILVAVFVGDSLRTRNEGWLGLLGSLDAFIGNFPLLYVNTSPCQIGGIDRGDAAAIEAEQE